jgi:hypothetical protein
MAEDGRWRRENGKAKLEIRVGVAGALIFSDGFDQV